MAVNLDTLPCPFCGRRLIHIGSWALSFDPPRFYHEWKHPPIKCYLNKTASDIPLFTATDDPNTMIAALALWNERVNHPQEIIAK